MTADDNRLDVRSWREGWREGSRIWWLYHLVDFIIGALIGYSIGEIVQRVFR